jgi:DNA-binding transcriptional LysR family regulator
MAKREPSWDELRTFFEVVRDGSLSGATRRLGLTQPTVGRHVDALEAALGVSLFTRSPRGLTPTPAAIALAPHGEAMAAAAAALSRSASSEAALDKGVVRVTASEIIGCEVLPAIFAGFHARHPGVAIETRRHQSQRGPRTGRRRHRRPYGSSDPERTCRPPHWRNAYRSLRASRLLRPLRRAALACGSTSSLRDRLRSRQSNLSLGGRDCKGAHAGGLRLSLRQRPGATRCAAGRVGIGGCQEGVARRSKDLIPILPGAFQITLEVWLVMHRDLKSTSRVRLMFDWLAQGLADYVKGKSNSAPEA